MRLDLEWTGFEHCFHGGIFVSRKRIIIAALCLIGVGSISTTAWLVKNSRTADRNLTDEALLALIKNDQKTFEQIMEAGLNLQDSLPAIDGQIYSVSEGMSVFERTQFMRHLNQKKISFIEQKTGKPFDIVSLAVGKNNLELFKQIALEKPNYQLRYGKNEWSLLHMASSQCAHKLTEVLHLQGKLNWDLKAKDGSTPLTLAAENDCLPMLSYWKEQKANFKAKDGRGLTALNILKKKKDAALAAFAASFEAQPRAAASVKPQEVDFYRKRKIPKDQIVDHSALIEPEDRPMEASETAEFSEFAD